MSQLRIERIFNYTLIQITLKNTLSLALACHIHSTITNLGDWRMHLFYSVSVYIKLLIFHVQTNKIKNHKYIDVRKKYGHT